MSAPEATGPAVESYLAEIAALLPGPPRGHASIMAELGSGLLDAAAAHRSAGLPPARADFAAIREFGDPGQVAAGFVAEIATRQARRAAVALLASGPLVGLLWVATARASHLGIPADPIARWADLPPGLRIGAALVAIAAVVTALTACLGIAVTGRLTRWLRPSPVRAPTAAAAAGVGAVSAEMIGLALLAAQAASTPGRLPAALAGAAAAAGLSRLLLARHSARQSLMLRRILTGQPASSSPARP
jgi:hypothetical protein